MTALPGSRTTFHRNRAGRAMVLLVALLCLSGPGSVVAQGDVDVVVNITVAFRDPYTPQPSAFLIPSANFEAVLVNGDDTVFVTNGAFERPEQIRLDALEGLEAETDGLVSVDAGTSGDPLYWLDLFTVDDVPYGAFTISRSGQTGTTITIFLGSVATFADGLAVAQQSVMVDEVPIFDGVDPGGLQALLDAALPGLGTGTGAEDEADAPREATPDPSDAFADQPGMIAEGVYMSPHHGYVLTWNDEWTFDPAYDNPVESDPDNAFDQVHLTMSGPELVFFGFYAGEPLPGDTFAEFMDRSSSPERLELEIGPSAEVIVSRIGVNAEGDEVGALIIRVTLEGYDFIVYEEYRPNEDGSAFAALQFLMVVDQVEQGLEATEGLEFEGGPVITLFTGDEIRSVAGGADAL